MRAANEGSRRRTLIESGCRTGRELSDCQATLGEGRVDGSTRHLVTVQREKMRAKVLAKALTQHPDQTARPVWVFPQFDKTACAWLLATPTPETYIPSRLFTEAMAAHLCLPSPCCQGKLGQPTGYTDRAGNPTVVDTFGDQVMATTLCFDTWRNRHDDIQRALVDKALQARVEVEAEVMNCFRDVIPAHAMAPGGDLEQVRARSGCVPDLRLGFQVALVPRPADYLPRRGRRPAVPAPPAAPTPRPALAPGGVDRFIAEIKICGAGPSNYPRGEARSRDKAADRRARGLPALYRGKLRAIDQKYNGTAVGAVGPCEARLAGLGVLLQVVVGAFGDVSTDLERIIRGIAESRVLYLSRESGRPVTDSWTGQVLGAHRRFFSAQFVRSQAHCLVSRMGHLGEEARDRAGQRQVSMAQEERARRGDEAHFAAYVRGRGRWAVD